jgi:hypothetical protein
MASPTDIITYIGVPLAVLGVMPIIYTFVMGLFTKIRVTRALRKNNIKARVSSRLLSGMVEVEVPVWELSPVPRANPAYWRECTCDNSIKGSKWLSYPFNRRSVQTENRILRLQLRDPIVLPGAKMKFDALMGYLSDLGAEIRYSGFRALRDSKFDAPDVTLAELVDDLGEATPILSVAGVSTGLSDELNLTLHQSSPLFKRTRQTAADLAPGWLMVHCPITPDGNDPSSTNDGSDASKAQEQKPGFRKFIFSVGVNTASRPNLTGVSDPPDLRLSLGRKWLTYILLAALYESENEAKISSDAQGSSSLVPSDIRKLCTVPIDISGIFHRFPADPELLIRCRYFALPVRFVNTVWHFYGPARRQLGEITRDFTDPKVDDTKISAYADPVAIPLSKVVSPSTQRDVSQVQARCLKSFWKTWQRMEMVEITGVDLYGPWVPGAPPMRPPLLIAGELDIDGFLPLRSPVAEHRIPLTVILHAILLGHPSVENLGEHLDMLLDTFGSGNEICGKINDLTDFAFMSALTVIAAIGRHAERFLCLNDSDFCMRAHPLVNIY